MTSSHRPLILLALLLCTPILQAQTPPTSPTAAELYVKACALLEADDVARVDFDRARMVPEIGQFLEDHHQIMDLLRDATHKQSANWPQPFDPGAMPSLNPFRSAARFALLQARYDLSQNQPQQAVTDTMVAIAVGRHIAQYHVLVTSLIDIGIENTAIDQLAQTLPQFSKDVVKSLPANLDALPRETTVADVLNGESALSTRLAVKQGVPPAMAADVVKFYAAVVQSAAAAPADFNTAVDAQVAQFAANPLVKTLAPTWKRVRVPLSLPQAKLAMLRTAIQIDLADPSSIQQSKDPFSDGPFIYAPVTDGSGGYDLTSKLPATLRVAGK